MVFCKIREAPVHKTIRAVRKSLGNHGRGKDSDMARKRSLARASELSLTLDTSGGDVTLSLERSASNGVVLSPVVRQPLQEQAYNKLREALMSGHFAPGQSITLRATAEQMGTSPMPVRDALRRLEFEHALTARSNRTLVVPEMTYASLTELRDVRVTLEGLAAEKAAQIITPAEIKTVGRHFEEMKEAATTGDLDAYMRANWAFHSAIYRASGSQLLVSLIEPTWIRIGPYVRLMFPDRKSLVDSLDNHLLALRALGARDSATARKAIAQDISDSAEGLATLLRARRPDGRPERRPVAGPRAAETGAVAP
jgi:DNA-binding GntR family transcriptional regulator